MIARRGLLGALLAAPAIIRPGLLMPISTRWAKSHWVPDRIAEGVPIPFIEGTMRLNGQLISMYAETSFGSVRAGPALVLRRTRRSEFPT